MNQPLPASPRTVQGSCHCGAIRFEFDFDPGAGTTRCNCTVCTKFGYWGTNVRPSAFRLVQGEDSLGDYSRSDYGHHRFCKVCGAHPFGHGNIPQIGGEFVSVNLNCLDQADLDGLMVKYLDGLHDTWATLNEGPYRSPFAPAQG